MPNEKKQLQKNLDDNYIERAKVLGRMAALKDLDEGRSMQQPGMIDMGMEEPEIVEMDEEMEELPPEEPMEELPPEEPMEEQMDEMAMLDSIQPEEVQMATAKLVEAGMMDSVTSEITPETIEKLQAVADMIDPGLYELENPEELKEFIDGINTGTIDLARSDEPELAAGAAGPLGGAGPVAGPVGPPAGAVGAAGALPSGGGPII